MRIKSIIIFTVFLFCPSLYSLSGENGAKAIFFSGEGPTVVTSSAKESTVKSNTTNQASGTSTEQFMGISYWIDLFDTNGNLTRVSPTRTFTSGDRIKLNIQSNRNGYLYVLNIGSSGDSHVLFPNPGVNSNLITAGLPYSVPFKTYMRFDNNPGEELLLIMLSPRPLGNLAPTQPAYGPLDNQQTDQVIQTARATGAKDIILEDDTTGPAPATYVVAPVSSLDSKVITMQVKLKHR